LLGFRFVPPDALLSYQKELHMRYLLPLAVLAHLSSGLAVHANDLLAPTQPIEQVVDHHVELRLQEENVKPAGPADDANLLRRLMLDLVGRIPLPAETKAFVESTDPDKKVKLVERLLASPAAARHLANDLDAFLMAGSRASIRDTLSKALTSGQSWDKIYRTLMLPPENDQPLKGAGEFLRVRVMDQDRLTAEISSLFFGVNVSCAQCHDHPLVQDWKQDHFYGMKSFLSRTFDNGGFLGERELGMVKFKTTKGQEKTAQMMFLTGKTVADASVREPNGNEIKRDKELFDKHKRNKTAPPAPTFSARKSLVDLSLEPEQRGFFARNIVNRMWFRLFGRGLVMPLDQMHSENPPSHPELLDWLARDTAEHGYDLRRLIRGLVLSQSYARSSRWHSDSLPPANLFAVARVRPLTPIQISFSLRLATADLSRYQASQSAEAEKFLEGLEAGARDFATLIEQPGEDFQVGVGEALLFSNSDRVFKEFLNDSPGKLLARLKACKNPREAIEGAFETALCRRPAPEEIALLEKFLKEKQDRPTEAYRDLLWALIASAEFRFNH